MRHVCDIRLRLNEWVSTPRYDEFRITAQKMIEKFDKYWYDMSGIFSIACIFDPRFKIRLVEYYFSMILGIMLLLVIVKEYKARYASSASSPRYSFSSLNTSHSMPSSGSYKSSTEWILGFTSFFNVGNKEVNDELDTYLGEKLVPFNVEEEFDVLAWWKMNGGNYPILSQIARNILAIPVTTVASEYAFNTGGRFVSPYRNRLHPSTLEALMCSHSWIRALCGGIWFSF
ncbi:BED-type domain-containing protein [Citrus sinensis]|uniref:BED-type domain-containing protein n=1 Tax=Citrus sinensis TaxID=2711 RepID=A0ACB8IIY4_CITSI|nr:BED-type domain-containing protein [Citrus sinensis]